MTLPRRALTQTQYVLYVRACLRCASSANSTTTVRVPGGPPPQRERERYVDGTSRSLVRGLGAQVEVRPQFISQDEERALLDELEPGLKRKRYEFDHWDDVSI